MLARMMCHFGMRIMIFKSREEERKRERQRHGTAAPLKVILNLGIQIIITNGSTTPHAMHTIIDLGSICHFSNIENSFLSRLSNSSSVRSILCSGFSITSPLHIAIYSSSSSAVAALLRDSFALNAFFAVFVNGAILSFLRLHFLHHLGIETKGFILVFISSVK